VLEEEEERGRKCGRSSLRRFAAFSVAFALLSLVVLDFLSFLLISRFVGLFAACASHFARRRVAHRRARIF
jgi:hypothetical protein